MFDADFPAVAPILTDGYSFLRCDTQTAFEDTQWTTDNYSLKSLDLSFNGLQLQMTVRSADHPMISAVFASL